MFFYLKSLQIGSKSNRIRPGYSYHRVSHVGSDRPAPQAVGPWRSHGHETVFGRSVPKKTGVHYVLVTRSDKATRVSFSNSSKLSMTCHRRLVVSLSSDTTGAPSHVGLYRVPRFYPIKNQIGSGEVRDG